MGKESQFCKWKASIKFTRKKTLWKIMDRRKQRGSPIDRGKQESACIFWTRWASQGIRPWSSPPKISREGQLGLGQSGSKWAAGLIQEGKWCAQPISHESVCSVATAPQQNATRWRRARGIASAGIQRQPRPAFSLISWARKDRATEAAASSALGTRIPSTSRHRKERCNASSLTGHPCPSSHPRPFLLGKNWIRSCLHHQEDQKTSLLIISSSGQFHNLKS